MRKSRFSDSQILAMLKQNEQGLAVGDIRGGPTSSDRLAAKLSYKLLVCVMPLILFFVRSVAECSPRPEEQNLLYYKPHLAFVHQTLNVACCGYKIQATRRFPSALGTLFQRRSCKHIHISESARAAR